jgi:hypothetical protein
MENVKKISWIFDERNKFSWKHIQLKVSSRFGHRVLAKTVTQIKLFSEFQKHFSLKPVWVLIRQTLSPRVQVPFFTLCLRFTGLYYFVL